MRHGKKRPPARCCWILLSAECWKRSRRSFSTRASRLDLTRKSLGLKLSPWSKNAAQSGFVMALNINPKDTSVPFRGTFVLRGAASKPVRAISARLMGGLMGSEAKPKIEFREGRSIVFVPYGGVPTNPGWAWWAEKSDLVVITRFPVVAEATLATLAGKNPSALDHPIVQELSKPEGTFHPASIAFIDVAGCPETPTKMTEFFAHLKQLGLHRLDVRWGFDDDALMTVTRLVAPKPRKALLAVFDQPTFEKNSLLPVPEGVESFVELSMNPAQLLETINGLGLPDAVKAQIDELTEDIQSAGKIDLQKDLLAHLGPRMVLYLAPGRSAATTNEESSLESAISKGLNTMSAASAMQSLLPKFTLVAEVKDPVAFARAMDAVVNTINNELKAQAIEMARHDEAPQGDQGTGDRRARPRRGTHSRREVRRRSNQAPSR